MQLSIFASRIVDTDAHALNDTPEVRERQLRLDWSRIVARQSFRCWLSGIDLSVCEGQCTLEQVQDRLYGLLTDNLSRLRSTYLYYTSLPEFTLGSQEGVKGDDKPQRRAQHSHYTRMLSVSGWEQLASDCKLLDLPAPGAVAQIHHASRTESRATASSSGRESEQPTDTHLDGLMRYVVVSCS
jgi:hypothetical protein